MGAVRELGRQLKRDGIEMVTLESTSDYWRIWFFVLEAAGLAVRLVNAAQARNLPGRPKRTNWTRKHDPRSDHRAATMGLSPVIGAGINLSPCWKITSLNGLAYLNRWSSPRPAWRPWTPVPYQPRFRHRIMVLGGSAGS